MVITSQMRSAAPPTKPNKPTPSAYKDVWGIFDSALKPVFDVDTCVEVGYKGETKVSQFPVERGSFANYNKVQEPYQIRLQLAVGGDGRRIQAFLQALEIAKNSTNLYVVQTPEKLYLDACMTGYNYKRTATNGRNMITADIELVEIRQVSNNYTSVANPVGKVKSKNAVSAQPIGKVQVVDPSSDAGTTSGNRPSSKFSADASRQWYADAHKPYPGAQ